MEKQNSQPANSRPAESTGILKPLVPAGSASGTKAVLLPALVILAIILFGSATGYFLAHRGFTGLSSNGEKVVSGEKAVSGPNEVGLKDEESFPDKAQGRLEENQSEEITEGSHQLIRPGGVSQTAYLTSSAVDLNQFLGKCVEVWGETFAAQQAGWLLDVGFVRKLDTCPAGL